MEETDYLIVGAGAAGLAFADTLLDETDATMTLVDRRTGVGGHWRDAYPFIRLHLSSALYGVNSTPLGKDQRQTSGRNAGFYEQATGEEVREYFEGVLHDRLEASGRVKFLGGHDHLGESSDGVQTIRELLTGDLVEIRARKVVDARYLEVSIPATHTPSFKVSSSAAFAPVNDLPALADQYERFTIIGAGKTSFDACLWLLDQDIDPDRIRWVRSREMWLTDRAGMQPLDDVGTLMNGLSLETEAAAENERSADALLQLEAKGRFMRLDESQPPTRWVGTMVSRPEVEALRTISDVVRMGHVDVVDPDRLVFSAGEVATKPGTLHVDCSATGLNPNPPTSVFSGNRITLQNVRHNSPSFNAALIAWVEANRPDEDEKNRLTPPNRYVSSADEFLGVHCRTWITEGIWQQETDLGAWIDPARLNLLSALRAHIHEPEAIAGVERFLTTVGTAVERHGAEVMAPVA